MDDNSAVTATSTPTDATMSTKICNGDYYTKNAIFDASITNAYDRAEYKLVNMDAVTTGTKHRSSIQYSESQMDILIQLSTNLNQQCCEDVSALYYDCYSSLAGVSYVNAACNNTPGSGNTAYHQVIKVLANNNIMSFDSSELDSVDNETIYNGVEVLNDMFGMTTATTLDGDTGICMLTYTDGGTLYTRLCSSYSNKISYADASSTADAEKQYRFNQWHLRETYWELHLTCYTSLEDNTLCASFANAEGANPKGIMIKKATLNITANTLYPQQTELDFLICYRYTATAGSLVLSGTTVLSSSTLMNAQIIHSRKQIGYTGNTTYFRIGYLNVYSLTEDVYTYVPTLLRIGGFMHEDDISTNKGIALFFDTGLAISSSELSTSMPLDPTECASPITSGSVCKYFSKKSLTATSITNLHEDYYPSLNGIVIGGNSVVKETEFNYYIPVKISAQIQYGFLALISDYSVNLTTTAVFKLFGSTEIIPTDNYQKITMGTNTFLLGGVAWTPGTGSTTNLDELSKTADWEVAKGVTNGYGTVNIPTSGSSFAKATANAMAFSTTSDIYPENTETNITIDASSTGWTDPYNDDQSSSLSQPNFQFRACAHFTMHSFIKFWSSDMEWTLQQTDETKPFKGQCTQMAITSYYTDGTSTATPTEYLIICPFEGTFSGVATSTAGTFEATLGTWKWPDYYGLNAPIGAHLRYLWTEKSGFLTAYLAEAKEGSALGDCTLGQANSIFALNTPQQKASMSITLLSSLTLMPKTSDNKDKEKMYIKLTINSDTTNSLATGYCSCGLAKIQCSVEKPDTTHFKFTLQNIDTTNEQTIPKALLTLTFWLSSTSTTDETLSYTAEIYAYFYLNYPLQSGTATAVKINTCDTSSDWGSASQIEKSLTVTTPSKHCMVMSARTYFSFSFSASYDVLDISNFLINLGFLGDANTQIKSNLRCGIYTSNTISHLFGKFDLQSLDSIKAEYRLQESTLLKPTSIGPVDYNFKCFGGQMLNDAPTTSSLITVINQIVADPIGTGNFSTLDDSYSSLKSVTDSSIATITMSRTFDAIGQDSTYIFNVQTTAKLDTIFNTESIRFLAGSYLYVEFARDIPPRFNKLGIIRCYHESNPTYCYYESERRIAFLARTDLSHNNTYGHNFSIVGVQRPSTITLFNTMYFALVPYKGTFNTMEFQDNSSISDSSPQTIQVTTLPVLYYSQNTSSQIRSTYNFLMHIKIPSSLINESIPIWIDFPEEYDEAMFLGWTPSCSLKNINMTENETVQEYVSSCSMNTIRRLKINITTSNETNITTSESLYNLSISSIPTYNYEQSYASVPLIWIGKSNATTIPYYKTNLGYFNATINLGAFAFTDTSKQLLTWEQNNIGCYKGTYQCKASLVVNTGDYFKIDISNILSSGKYSEYFSFSPATLEANIGKPLEFQIAPKSDATSGLYQLLWKHEVVNYYSTIPPLFLIVLNNKTSLAPAELSYEIPDGGRSLPIIISFKDKMPQNDITITGTATSDLVDGEGTENSRYVIFQSASQSLQYIEDYTQDQIQFVLNGSKITGDNEPSTPTAILSWSLSGTNADSYTVPANVTVTIIDAPTGTPELTVATPDTSNQIGKMSIYAICSHPGTLYYITSQDFEKTQIQYTEMKSASEDISVQQTDIGTIFTNPSRSLYGFKSASAAQSQNEITFEDNLQSEAKYYMRVYCVNLISVSSEPVDVTWTQQTNGGKPLVAKFEFGQNVTNSSNITTFTLSSLKESQRKKVACLICQYTQNEKDRVFGKGAIACQASNDTVGESTQETSTNTTNSTRLLIDIGYRQLESSFDTAEYFVIMPNLFRVSSDLSTTQTLLESQEFSTAIESSNILGDLIVSSVSCSLSSSYPTVPKIESPILVPSEQEISFTWTGANNTDGFIFVGVAPSSNTTLTPSVTQLKKNSGFELTGQSQGFYYKDESVTLIVTPLSMCLDYKYYWVATNEDPDTFQYQTEVYEGVTTTIGCATFGTRIQIILALLYLNLIIF